MQLNSFFQGTKIVNLRAWIAVVLALCSFLYLYRDSISVLLNYWNDYGTYSHGYLTVLLSIFLLYTSVMHSRLNHYGPSILSGIAIFCISIVWFLAYLAKINTIQMLCVPFFIYFTISFFCGLKNYKALIVPVFILLFTVPIWSVTLPALQGFAVVVTNKLLSISDLEYLVAGNRVILSQGIFQIEESCSGLRYLLVGVLLALVYGFLNYSSKWSTFILIFCTVLIMLIGNIVRILVIIWLGVLKGMDYPLVQDHENLGWVLFALFLIPMFTIARYLNPNILQNKDHKVNNVLHKDKSVELTSLCLLSVIYLIIISIAPLYAGHLKSNYNQIASLNSDVLLSEKGWNGPTVTKSVWSPKFSLYSEMIAGQYTRGNYKVDFGLYLYSDTQPKGELINANNQVVDTEKWNVLQASYNEMISGKIETIIQYVNKLTIRSVRNKDCRRIWYWFVLDGKLYTKKWQVKFQETVRTLMGKSGSAIVTLSTNCNENPDAVLENFVFDNDTEIKNLVNW